MTTTRSERSIACTCEPGKVALQLDTMTLMVQATHDRWNRESATRATPLSGSQFYRDSPGAQPVGPPKRRSARQLLVVSHSHMMVNLAFLEFT